MLFIASTGGHLAQLCRIAALVGAAETSTWVTFDSPQSRSLLATMEDVHFVPYVRPRDLRGVFSLTRYCLNLAASKGYDAAISTGAGVALALPVLRARGLRSIYVESVSRVYGPSLTGRILGSLPGIERRTQHRLWSSKRWPYEFTLLDQFESFSHPGPAADRPLRVLVTLGTIKPYRFDSALLAVRNITMRSDEVTWQVGVTDGLELPGIQHETMSRAEFNALAASVDVVVTHAGVGTILDLFQLGVCPVVLPRRADNVEHVDDHQLQIAEEVASRELAVVSSPLALTREHLLTAARRRVRPVFPSPPKAP